MARKERNQLYIVVLIPLFSFVWSNNLVSFTGLNESAGFLYALAMW